MQIAETETFASWLKGLRDQSGRRTILRRVARIATADNFGDHAGIGDGKSELRIHVGPGYRVYYTIRRAAVVLLLCGGDKKSQARDVEKAKEMAAQLK